MLRNALTMISELGRLYPNCGRVLYFVRISRNWEELDRSGSSVIVRVWRWSGDVGDPVMVEERFSSLPQLFFSPGSLYTSTDHLHSNSEYAEAGQSWNQGIRFICDTRMLNLSVKYENQKFEIGVRYGGLGRFCNFLHKHFTQN